MGAAIASAIGTIASAKIAGDAKVAVAQETSQANMYAVAQNTAASVAASYAPGPAPAPAPGEAPV